MKKRVLASALWFYAMWSVGAMTAAVLGFSPALGPILGTAAAAIVGIDPRRVIWSDAPRASANRAPSVRSAPNAA